MQYTVYKSLDKPSSLFGLQGSYLYYAVGGAIAAAMIGFMFGSVTNSLVGMLTFIILLAVDYFVVLRIQANYSERERSKWLCSHRLPNFITVPPKRLSIYTKDKISDIEKRKRTII